MSTGLRNYIPIILLLNRYLAEFETRENMTRFYRECKVVYQPIKEMMERMKPVLQELQKVAPC